MTDPADIAAMVRQAERENAARERKSAVAEALRGMVRDSQISAESGFVRRLEERKARRQLEKAQQPDTTTNHADDITHAPGPLGNYREDH